MGISTDAARMVIERLDTVIDLLEQLIRAQSPEPADTMIGQRVRDLLEVLVAASLPSSPRSLEEITVDTLGVTLVENTSEPLLFVRITNDDPAQPLWVSPEEALVTTGEIIRPWQSRAYVLPMGAALFGVCAIATISARVSQGHDLYSSLRALQGV